MNTAYLTGVGSTPFGRLDGGAIDLMARAATQALETAGVHRREIDGVLCGYATTLPHLMLATLFAERFGIEPAYAHGMQMGGATGAGMVMLAADLVRSGRCRRVLVVAGENRLSGQQRDSAIATLAQVGDPDFEVPNGTMVPTYYALLASRYMHESGLTERDLAGFAVAMRDNAARHPDAHLREKITVDDVLASKPIASPLKLLDCCPISDGAVAFVVCGAGARRRARGDRRRGAGAPSPAPDRGVRHPQLRRPRRRSTRLRRRGAARAARSTCSRCTTRSRSRWRSCSRRPASRRSAGRRRRCAKGATRRTVRCR